MGESCGGPYRFEVNRGRSMGGTIKLIWSRIYSARRQLFQCAGGRPGICGFLGDMDVGGMLLSLAYLDQMMYACFSATRTPKP